MAKDKKLYICSSCGYESPKWAGKCPNCGEWSTLEESSLDFSGGGSNGVSPAKIYDFSKSSSGESEVRISVGIGEVDRVLGSSVGKPGLVKGEVVLLSGEPGIGKSTLLLQICLKMIEGLKVLYVSGEESANQLARRFKRLSGKNPEDFPNFYVTEETNVEKVVAVVGDIKPDLVVVDSIQAVDSSDVNSFAGSMSQVKVCGYKLTHMAKALGIPVFIVGQVTKGGTLAGPKVLEHVVDAVIYFEGDEFGMYRILRGVKNRFGSTDEVGIFEMTSDGLQEVVDPSNVFCSNIDDLTPGSAMSAIFKGSRVLFVEVQALTSEMSFGSPRRLPTGFNKSRLEMLCAVLSRRVGLSVGNEDVFINISGGLKIDDPAVDLAVCMAIASAEKNIVLGNNVFVGEVSLAGMVRPVSFQSRILSEGKRRGLSSVDVSKSGNSSLSSLVKRFVK